MPDQVDEQIKSARVKQMQQTADRVRSEICKKMMGQEEEVLLEKAISGSMFTGYTKRYVPVVVSAFGHKAGDIVRVKLGEFDGQRCQSTLLS